MDNKEEKKHYQATFSIMEKGEIIEEEHDNLVSIYRRMFELIEEHGMVVLVTISIPVSMIICYISGRW